MLSDGQLRLALAQEVAEQIRAIVCKEKCPDCRYPLIEKPEQGIAQCWFCTTDRIAAQRAATILTKIKMAANGIFVIEEKMHPAMACRREQEERSSWPEGWAL